MTRKNPYAPYDEISQEQVEAAHKYLAQLGFDLSTTHTDMTAYRLTHYLRFLKQGGDEFHLTAFPNEDPCVDHMVVVPQIPFWSACSHHCLPFMGTVSVGYIPKDLVIGLSKIPLLVQYVARGYWLQEHLAKMIADKLEEALNPQGVGVYIEARHTCQLLDLKEPPIPVMKTAVLRGILMHGPAAREEFYRHCD